MYNYDEFLNMVNSFMSKSYISLWLEDFIMNLNLWGNPWFVYVVSLVLFIYLVLLFSLVFSMLLRLLDFVLSPVVRLVSFLFLVLLSFVLGGYKFGGVYWSYRKFSAKLQFFSYKWSTWFFPNKSVTRTL
jgi:hypothetical protein